VKRPLLLPTVIDSGAVVTYLVPRPSMGAAERLRLPEWDTAHGPACCCMRCVLKRGKEQS
jgi:hypothetical protein